MHHGALAELATGEGKTLIATAPDRPQRLARQGRPRHHRQRLPGPARRRLDVARLQRLGLTVGILQQKMEDEDRDQAYRRHHLRHRRRSSASISCATA